MRTAWRLHGACTPADTFAAAAADTKEGIDAMKNRGTRLAVMLAILCLLALLSPWVLGSWHQGARNWITIIPDKLTVQPSSSTSMVIANRSPQRMF